MKRKDIIDQFKANDDADPDKSTEYLASLTADQLGIDRMQVFDALVDEYDREECPICGKSVRRGGLRQHTLAKHPEGG